MTDKLENPLSRKQRILVLLILLGILIMWVRSEKIWFSIITFGALLLTFAGFSKNVFLSSISARFGLLVATVAYTVSRKFIQLIYIVIIVPLNFLVSRKINKQYNIQKPEPEFLNMETNIDFERYF